MGGVVKGVGKAIFGGGGSSPGFISPGLELANKNAAYQSFALGRQANIIQGKELGALQRGPSAQDQAMQEIERRRAALNTGLQNERTQLAQGIARRGLSGSAAGLFGEQRLQNRQNDLLQQLSGSLPQLQEQFANSRVSRLNQILQGAQIPAPMVYQQGQQGSPGLLGSVLPGLGQGLGNVAGKKLFGG